MRTRGCEREQMPAWMGKKQHYLPKQSPVLALVRSEREKAREIACSGSRVA